ncbi:MAG: TerB family tellurite resistance protein [Planctomycetota bacterium]
MLDANEAQAVLALSLMAALADGRSAAEEREHLRTLFDGLAAEHELPGLPALYQKVMLKQTSLADEAARLRSEEAKRMAFEMAVCIADADGKATEAEQAFLDQLEAALALDHEEAVAFEHEAERLGDADETVDADALLAPVAPSPAYDGGRAMPASAVPSAAPAGPAQTHAPSQMDAAAALAPAEVAAMTPAVTTASAESSAEASPAEMSPAEIQGIILRYAILNGALELMPQNLATMAILPLQTRMVYVIGKRHGHSLGAGHIKEFIATLGMGATSQMLENFARKALGKLAKKALGKTAGAVVKTATGPMMTFASTYAIGKVAHAYYAGGRTLSSVDLKSLFTQELGKGKALYDQHQPQIANQAGTLNPADVLRAVRGGLPA